MTGLPQTQPINRNDMSSDSLVIMGESLTSVYCKATSTTPATDQTGCWSPGTSWASTSSLKVSKIDKVAAHKHFEQTLSIIDLCWDIIEEIKQQKVLYDETSKKLGACHVASPSISIQPHIVPTPRHLLGVGRVATLPHSSISPTSCATGIPRETS